MLKFVVIGAGLPHFYLNISLRLCERSMTLPAAFSLHYSTYSAFLAAEIWHEENGNVLSVLSALARLDLDPWAEAAQLAELPQEAAASALAATLSRLPGNDCTRPAMTAITTRLVQALPSRAHGRSEGRGKPPREASSRNKLLWIGLALATVLMAMSASGWPF